MAITDINAAELRELINTRKDELELIDVREKEEYDIIHLKGSKLIPVGEIQHRKDEIDWSKDVVFICRSGNRSKLAAYLTAMDRDVKNLKYGIYECYADGILTQAGKGEHLEIDEKNIGRYF